MNWIWRKTFVFAIPWSWPSIEKQIENTKDRYYGALEESNTGWHEEENDPTPFIRYMLQAILACYTELEERVGLMAENEKGSTAYDIVKKYTEKKSASLLEQMLLLVVRT